VRLSQILASGISVIAGPNDRTHSQSNTLAE
jgi:hypothetical protein